MKQRSYTLAFLFGTGAALTGAMIASGYAFGIPGLIRPWSELPASVFTDALCLLAGGIALALAARWPSTITNRIVSALGCAIAALAVLAGVERAFDVASGLDFGGLHDAIGMIGVAPGRIAPMACVCFAMLGGALAALPLASGRRAGIAMNIVATACAAIGATSVAGYLLDVEFMVSWPSRTPLSPQAACGLLLLGLGFCCLLLSRAKAEQRAGPVDEARAIHLTAAWILSLIAVAAGISTFALAQHEYQALVRADLARTLHERRAFLEYAIHEHRDQLDIAVRALATAIALDTQALATSRFDKIGDKLLSTGFTAWRVENAAGVVASSGTFVDRPELALRLADPYGTELLLHESYFLRTRVPIRENGRLVGHIVVEERFPELTQLKLEADSWGETGEMGLCVAADVEMECVPIRSRLLAERFPRQVNGRRLPMGLALDRETGMVQTLDYRQHRVLAAYGPVGYTGLGMVIKIDAAELNQPLGRSFGIAVLLLIALVSAGTMFARSRLVPLTDALVEAREEARRVAAQFEAAAESSLDACFIMEAVRDTRHRIVDFRVQYMNPSGEVIVRRRRDDVVGATLSAILMPAQSEYFIERYRKIVATGQPLADEFRVHDEGTSPRWIAHQAVKLGDGVSVTARDITRIKSVERQLRERADQDVLTGLPNRAIFFDRLDRALADARITHTGVAVLFLDVDRFKQVNDTHGHPAGDAVLREFAARLRSVVRGSDTIARLGGDEFAMILPGLPEIEQAERVAADVLAAIGARFDVEGVHLEIGTSIGIAYSHGGNETPESLLGRADRKLYQAKSEGRGRFSSTAAKRAA